MSLAFEILSVSFFVCILTLVGFIVDISCTRYKITGGTGWTSSTMAYEGKWVKIPNYAYYMTFSQICAFIILLYLYVTQGRPF